MLSKTIKNSSLQRPRVYGKIDQTPERYTANAGASLSNRAAYLTVSTFGIQRAFSFHWNLTNSTFSFIRVQATAPRDVTSPLKYEFV